MTEIYNNFIKSLEQFLHQPGKIDHYASILESSTGIKRIYIAKAFLVFFFLYMIFGYFAQLICNFLGFIYPAYVSIKALESTTKEDDTRWLTYWVVFAFFSVIEFFSDFIFNWFPFYWLAKVFFLIWCYLPIENNGSHYIYKNVMKPLFLKNSPGVDKLAKKIYSEAKQTVSTAWKDD